MILRGQTVVVVVVTVSLVAVDFLFWTPVSERASSSASVHPRSDYCIALRFCLLSLSPRFPQSSAAYQLVHDYCNRAVKDQLNGRLKTQTIFSLFLMKHPSFCSHTVQAEAHFVTLAVEMRQSVLRQSQ